jgi:hypothetical protein
MVLICEADQPACMFLSSVEEEAVGAVDGLNQVGQASGTQHDVRLDNWKSSVVVSGRWNDASREAWVGVVNGKLVTLLSPSGPVHGV